MGSAKAELLGACRWEPRGAGRTGPSAPLLPGEPPPLGKSLLACVTASLGTGRKQPAPSGLKIAEHYGHTLVFEGKT